MFTQILARSMIMIRDLRASVPRIRLTLVDNHDFERAAHEAGFAMFTHATGARVGARWAGDVGPPTVAADPKTVGTRALDHDGVALRCSPIFEKCESGFTSGVGS